MYIIQIYIDECLEDSGGCRCDPNLEVPNECSVSCTNTFGSFACSCIEGYYLGTDEFTCYGNNNCIIAIAI